MRRRNRGHGIPVWSVQGVEVMRMEKRGKKNRKSSLRKALYLGWISAAQSLFSMKSLLLLICLVMILLPEANEVRMQFQQAAECRITPWELYLGIFNGNRLMYCGVVLLIVIFLSGAGEVRKKSEFYLIRMTKCSWAAGQFVYVFLMTAAWLFLVWLVVTIACVPVLTFQTDWSRGARVLAAAKTLNIGIDTQILASGSMPEMAALQLALTVLLGMFLGNVICVLTMSGFWKIGLAADLLLIVLDLMIGYSIVLDSGSANAFSPVTLGRLSSVSFGRYAFGRPPVWGAMLILAGGNLILFFIELAGSGRMHAMRED